MRKLILILLVSICCINARSQDENPIRPGSTTEQQLENLSEQQEGEPEDDTYLQSLIQYKRNQLNLNTADVSELKELRLLSDLQIQNLLRYRQLLGNLISIYELQAIPTWDVETITKLLPFVKVGSAVSLSADLSQRFTSGDHSLLMRVQQVIEKSAGYTKPDTVANRYAGSRQHLFFRYKYVYRNVLQFGIVGDKDAGEQFLKGSQTKGFDFYSLHLFARKLGRVKLLALGDFTVNMGQGLIHWQSLAFKKSADVLGVKRQADILRPYNSAGEYNFHRGIGVTLGRKAIEFTAFASLRNLDATVNAADSFSRNEDYISAILNTGYHRTSTEIRKKNVLKQTTYGGNISYNRNNFHIGANGVAYHFSTPLQPSGEFAITGNRWHNYSIDYSYTYRNVHFFGEAAMDKRNAKAVVSGLLAALDPKVDVSLVYRNIEKNYRTLYGNAFTETILPTNEKGLFAGVSVKPVPFLKIDAYSDIFSFPWLKFRVDAPSKGSEQFVQLSYRPNKQVEVYTRYRNESKAVNLSGLNLPTRVVVNRPRQNWRTQFSFKPNRQITLRNRVELVWYDGREPDRSEKGFLTYFDVGYQPAETHLSINTRLQYFETDGFDSRLYAYESDVLYSYSIPQFIGKGLRYYINLNYDVTKRMHVWLRWAQTIYQDQKTISSGLDQINGNTKSEVKFQVMYNF